VLIFALVLFFYDPANLNLKLAALLFFLENIDIQLFLTVQNSINSTVFISDIILIIFFFSFILN